MGMRVHERQSGQALVESAVALPIALVLMASVVQLGWVAYCESCLSSALAHAQYSISTADLAGGISADELVRSRMIEASPVLSSGSLAVSNASVEMVESKARTIELSDADFDEYRFATKNEMTVRARITADVDYVALAVFGIAPEIHLVRHVESSRVADARFELG